jgi:hypothetical protein
VKISDLRQRNFLSLEIYVPLSKMFSPTSGIVKLLELASPVHGCDHLVGSLDRGLASCWGVVGWVPGRSSGRDCSMGAESGKNWGRLCGQRLVIGGVGEVGVPASVVVGEGVVRVQPRYL